MINIPKIRQVLPSLFAADIVSVQPMTGPTGKIFVMKNRYYADSKITYRYLESSGQHNFTVGNHADLDEILNWCIEMFGPAGHIDHPNKQWCHTPFEVIFFNKEEAEWFTLKWIT